MEDEKLVNLQVIGWELRWTVRFRGYSASFNLMQS